ncbi:intein [Micromonospora sagamiensis]|uniref:Intein n=2 Tax=Micromonospora sagamiensis TaxID=47875 RepID=A0A562WDZ6_9ACTN|nr:intein [Micromonospora sagamiensis]
MSAGSCSTGKPRHSFDPATLVLLADGTARPIGDIQPGDEVVATDPETGETSAEPVTRLHVNIDRELTNLTVRGSGAERAVTLETTAHHPFWDATDRQWVDAGKLQVGHRLLVHDDKRLEGDGTGAGAGGPGREVTVVAVDNFTGSEVMRDLTVATHHTYYVIAGNTPVLVHNINQPRSDICGPNGEPIHDIPQGSSGGVGAGEEIPRSMLAGYNIGVQADRTKPTPMCSYCRHNTAEAVDHVEARNYGGDLSDENTTPICRSCNSSKRDRMTPYNPPAGYTGIWPPPHWPASTPAGDVDLG